MKSLTTAGNENPSSNNNSSKTPNNDNNNPYKNMEPTFRNIMTTTEPMQRFKLLKQYVFQNIQLPKSQYKYLDNGVKDYILRKNGLDIIRQRRIEV